MPGANLTAVEILAQLVAFDTTSHKSNLDIVAWIETYLYQHGVVAERVTSQDGEKASLFATIGPANLSGIALSGHTDVVPVEGQTWDSDPFVLRADNGRLHGRGTSDMKGFLACVLAAVPDFQGRQLRTPIHLAFSYDEEVGCLGVRPMIAEFDRRFPRPRLTIVGEPTSMRVVDAHKGPVRWQVQVTGRAAHSSMAHLGVNAVTYAMRLVAELEQIEAELKSVRCPRFDPPYATLQVTRIDGGTANNIVPVSCRFVFEIRAVPGTDADALEQRLRSFADMVCLPEMRAVAPESQISIERANTVPPFAADPSAEVIALALKLSEQNETHTVSYATEAGLFQAAGASAVVCGPGDIAQAHTANEWIAVNELEKCADFLRRLGAWAER